MGRRAQAFTKSSVDLAESPKGEKSFGSFSSLDSLSVLGSRVPEKKETAGWLERQTTWRILGLNQDMSVDWVSEYNAVVSRSYTV